MRIGVITLHPDRLRWYASSFPGHSFVYFAPDALVSDTSACENYIVDADMLTEDHASYGMLVRYLNRHVVEMLVDNAQDPFLPRRFGEGFGGAGCSRFERAWAVNRVEEHASSGIRYHTIIHRERKCR